MVKLRHTRRTGVQQLLIARLCGKQIGRYRLHSVFEGKPLRPRARQQHVRALFHHQTRGQHRVTQVADACHGPRFQGDTVHDAGIQLVGFIPGKDRTDPRIK